MLTELLDALDPEDLGVLERQDLGRAARRLGWGWNEAPLRALLDLLTLAGPLPRAELAACLREVMGHRLGPYGPALRRAWPLYRRDRPGGDTAMLVIDPQRAFTAGSWMRSFGPGGAEEVLPIARAFEALSRRLAVPDPEQEVMFTRCPFPPGSYGWDPALAGVLDPTQPYFIKPGNSALFPPDNGYGPWVQGLLERGVRTLILAGCTLNSCVRITALETHRAFAHRGLDVVVDLALCGARAGNHLPDPRFGGRSSVEAALRQLQQAGVRVQEAQTPV